MYCYLTLSGDSGPLQGQPSQPPPYGTVATYSPAANAPTSELPPGPGPLRYACSHQTQNTEIQRCNLFQCDMQRFNHRSRTTSREGHMCHHASIFLCHLCLRDPFTRRKIIVAYDGCHAYMTMLLPWACISTLLSTCREYISTLLPWAYQYAAAVSTSARCCRGRITRRQSVRSELAAAVQALRAGLLHRRVH